MKKITLYALISSLSLSTAYAHDLSTTQITVAKNSFGSPILDLSNQGITSINNLENVNGISQVRAIFLQNNKISVIRQGTFANMPHLRTINLGGNRIHIIASGAFQELPVLQELNLADDQLHDNELKNLPESRSLKTLSLNNNRISQITHMNLPYYPILEKLYLANNEITQLSLPNLPKLRYLDLRYNLLETINTEMFYKLTNLEEVWLSGNNLSATLKKTLKNKFPTITFHF